MDYEVIVVGGGSAGLSAALVLGRCGRHALVCDDGKPRNAAARGLHGFVTRDGIPPAEFLEIARKQALAYPTIEFSRVKVDDADRVEGGFMVLLADGRRLRCRKLLLATGLVDALPEIEGFRQFWGKSAFICPFCDGWEIRGQRIAVFGQEEDVHDFALEMLQWTKEIVICTDGPAPFDDAKRARLKCIGIELCEKKVRRLEGEGTQLQCVRFDDGSALDCGVIFLATRQHQRSSLPEKLGCPPDDAGMVPVDYLQKTRRRGVFIAGNAATGLQASILAAAEGFKAAYAINEELLCDWIDEKCPELRAASKDEG